MSNKVGSTVDAVAKQVEKDLGVEHVVRAERTTNIRSSYSWSTDYNKERFEQVRTINLPEGLDVGDVYAYQMLTGVDLCHMVIFNANVQGIMSDEEFLDILSSTKKVLQKVIPYLKDAKKRESEVYEEMISIYKRVKEELVENGILK